MQKRIGHVQRTAGRLEHRFAIRARAPGEQPGVFLEKRPRCGRAQNIEGEHPMVSLGQHDQGPSAYEQGFGRRDQRKQLSSAIADCDVSTRQNDDRLLAR